MVDWDLKKLDLTCDREPLPFIVINSTGLNHIFLKVVQKVFLPLKIEEFVHSMEETKMNGWITRAKTAWRVLCNLLLARKYFPALRRGRWLFKSIWQLSTESACKFQRSFEKTKEVKRGRSGKLLRNWDTEKNELSQLNISSYAVKKGLFQFVFHIFTSLFFAGLEGRSLSNSSITGVSEVNVNIVTTWPNQWKRNNGENL